LMFCCCNIVSMLSSFFRINFSLIRLLLKVYEANVWRR
jgi:hypothetical protein